MAKSSRNQRDVDSLSKNEILEDEDRKASKHRRKRFSEFLEEDESFQSFNLNFDSDIELDDETLAKYLRK